LFKENKPAVFCTGKKGQSVTRRFTAGSPSANYPEFIPWRVLLGCVKWRWRKD